MRGANAPPARAPALCPFPVPEGLASRDIALRRQTEDDASFQDALFIAARWQEFAALPWTEAQKHAFLAQQSALQQQHYRQHYPSAELYTVLAGGAPIGRFYIDRLSPAEIRLVDILFAESYRGQGLGTAFLCALQQQARQSGQCLGLHVEEHNPARRLYQRLGFGAVAARPPYIYMTWSPD